jgi:hypothetical protein
MIRRKSSLVKHFLAPLTASEITAKDATMKINHRKKLLRQLQAPIQDNLKCIAQQR